MKYRVVQGDLFNCSATAALAHCVSKDFHMSKGIAVPFKTKFEGVDELLAQNVKIGECAYLVRENRYIFYLVTKKKYWGKPNMSTLKSSLESMRSLCEAENVTELCMPKIAAGLDKLDWDEVESLIKEIFLNVSIDITIYTL